MDALAVAAAALRQQSRARQGLPPVVTDPAALRRVAVLLTEPAEPKAAA